MLELARGLTQDALLELATLEADTVAADGGRLKLEWGALGTRSGDAVEDVLWREEGRLVGFTGLYSFGGSTIEVAGMVHPDFRRRGIGTSLLDEAAALCRERGHDRFLLIAPRTSVGSRAMAEVRGGVLDHSEHAMDLIGAVTDGPSDPTLELREAARDDIPEIARILTEAFGHPWNPVDVEAEREPTLVAAREGAVIATMRVHRTPEEWGIYGFAVEPTLQGGGIGRDLLRRVCRQASEAGVGRLHLEVEVNNDRALGLYTSLGFTRTSTEDYFSIPL
jgi:ribosomal protein S18 acetylase RimI-like enzyme